MAASQNVQRAGSRRGLRPLSPAPKSLGFSEPSHSAFSVPLTTAFTWTDRSNKHSSDIRSNSCDFQLRASRDGHRNDSTGPYAVVVGPDRPRPWRNRCQYTGRAPPTAAWAGLSEGAALGRLHVSLALYVIRLGMVTVSESGGWSCQVGFSYMKQQASSRNATQFYVEESRSTHWTLLPVGTGPLTTPRHSWTTVMLCSSLKMRS